MNIKRSRIYNIGDRVAERPKPHGLTTCSAKGEELEALYRSQRYGTVIEVINKTKRIKNLIDARITPELIREANVLKNQGFSYRQIAVHFKIKSHQTILKWIKRVEEEGESKAFAGTRIVSEPYLVIQWDHLKSPSEHAQMRICPVSELERLTKEVIVPGE